MAGDWIKLEVTTPDKPEVHQIAEQLGIDPDAVLGKLIRVWSWADQQTFDGNAGSVTRSLLDRITGVHGFADAMAKTGWLTSIEGDLTFPHFNRHNGKTAKTRALTRKRVQGHRNANVTQGALPREEKRESIESNAANESPRESSTTESQSEPKSYPDDFEQFWQAYPVNAGGRKRGKKVSYTHWTKVPKADRAQLVTAATNYAAETPEYIRDPERFIKADWWRDWIEKATPASSGSIPKGPKSRRAAS